MTLSTKAEYGCTVGRVNMMESKKKFNKYKHRPETERGNMEHDFLDVLQTH